MPGEWRDAILDGVEQVVKIGCPGTMVVYGRQAEPIFTATTARDLLIAAAEFGSGRVVVFTHDGYTNCEWFS